MLLMLLIVHCLERATGRDREQRLTGSFVEEVRQKKDILWSRPGLEQGTRELRNSTLICMSVKSGWGGKVGYQVQRGMKWKQCVHNQHSDHRVLQKGKKQNSENTSDAHPQKWMKVKLNFSSSSLIPRIVLTRDVDSVQSS